MKKSFYVLLILITLLLLAGCGQNGDQSNKYSLFLEIEGEGEVFSGELKMEDGIKYQFDEGTVKLTAIPNEGWQFSKWKGDAAGENSSTTNILMDKNKSVTAVFIEDEGDPEDPVIETIIEVENIELPSGTTEDEAIAALAASTVIIDSDGNDYQVDLEWTITDYDGNSAGEYTAIGTFELPEGVEQSEPPVDLIVTATVTVYINPDNFDFDISTRTITGYNTEGGLDVVIPVEINGVPVEHIGELVFDSLEISSVEFPDGLKSIGNKAFYNNKLSSVVIPDSVELIGISAFEDNLIDNLLLPEDIVSIGGSAFRSNQLTAVEVPVRLEKINSYLFSDNQLNTLIIPEGVKRIGQFAFSNNSLMSVDIGESVESISDYAFYDNELSSLEIPDSVNNIGSYAFADNLIDTIIIGSCVTMGSHLVSNSDNNFRDAYNDGGIGLYYKDGDEWIRMTHPGFFTFANAYVWDYDTAGGLDVIIPEEIDGFSVEGIGFEAFIEKGIDSIILPEELKTIRSCAFSGNNLTSLDLPDSIESIGSNAFFRNQLTELRLPDSIDTIDRWVFANNQLTTINIPETVERIEQYAFCSNEISTIILPDGLITLEDSAFSANQLTRIQIPESVEEIGFGAFRQNQLESVIIPDDVELGKEVFVYNSTLAEINIGQNVTIGDNLISRMDNDFREAYEIGGAGEYHLVGGVWEKQ
ncbi:MAG: leucine-rich repeat protein [Halanaerobiales bacterium]